MRHRFALIFLTILLAAGFGAASPTAALADGDDNSAVAINTKDGSSLFRFAFEVRRVAGDVVDNVNQAVAYSRCESCRTTAIAIQIVLVESSPSTVTPQNIAIAINDQCTLCQTFASAYQFVIGTNGPVKFTTLGHQQLAEIKRDLRALRHEDLSPAELDARVSAIVDRLRVVLATQLVPADRGDEEGDEDEDDEEQTDLDEEQQPTTSSTVETGTTETTTVTTPAETTTTPTESETETAPTTTETTP